MLSAKKVKLHGMKDNRWTTRDKITQHKGLINLFTRDRKIIQVDTQIAAKKQQQLTEQLLKNIAENRNDLDNAIRGDKQQIRNALQEHRSLQLAYQDLHALQIIDHIHQENFNKRKELDRIGHKMRVKTEKLIYVKLELAEAEDLIKYDRSDCTPEQVRSKVITAQVQDAILKTDAAISVSHIYKKILKIMKKDAIYFDAVLNTLSKDSLLQNKCMIRTVLLGQLATEYLDDRQSEFLKLEKIVKRDMVSRVQELQESRQHVNGLDKQLRVLIRRDSDVNVANCTQHYRTISELDMLNDLGYIKDVFQKLQDATKVTDYERVFPCIQEQSAHFEKLSELVAKYKEDCSRLTLKSAHAEYNYYKSMYTMNENTFGYKQEKQDLLDELQGASDRIRRAQETIAARGELLVLTRKYLQQLVAKCRPIVTDKESRKRIQIKQSAITIMYSPEPIEEDGLKMINALTSKLSVLVRESEKFPPLEGEAKDWAEQKYRAYVLDNSSVIETSVAGQDVDVLYEGITMEDAQIPTNEFIKAQSLEMVLANSVSEEEELGQKKSKK